MARYQLRSDNNSTRGRQTVTDAVKKTQVGSSVKLRS